MQYIQRTLLLLLIHVFCLVLLKSQCTVEHFTIDNILEFSDEYILGEVSGLTYHFDESNKRIFTIYIIKSEKSERRIAVQGGIWKNITEIVSPGLNLNIGDFGLFLIDNKFQLNDQKSVIPILGPYNYLKYNNNFNSFTGPHDMYKANELVRRIPSLDSEIKELNVESNPLKLSTPKIDSIVPNVVSAGTESVVTIYGKSFGSSPDGFSKVEFRNPDIGTLINAYENIPSNHIISWSSREIKLIVPGRDPSLGKAGAGSGSIRVTDKSGDVGTGGTLKILYNRFVKGVKDKILYQNDNDIGGYTFTFNNNFIQNELAMNDFISATEKWQCGIQSNIVIGGSTAVNCKSNDGINLVAFDNNCPLPSGVLAQTTHWFISCSDGTPIFLEMDLIFDSNTNWSYGDAEVSPEEYDFATIALHEIGHAHGIGHNLETNSLMFPTIFPGVAIDTIDSFSIICGQNIVSESELLEIDCLSDQYKALPPCDSECDMLLSLLNIGPCTESETLVITFSISHINNGNNGFSVYLNEEVDPIYFGDYNNTGITEFSVELNDNEDVTIKVVDNEYVDCQSSASFSTINCMCSIEGSITAISSCSLKDSVQYLLTLNHSNQSDNGFDVFLDGEPILGSPFSYENNETETLINILGDDNEHEILVVDNDKEYCMYKATINVPDCICMISGELEFESCNLGKAEYLLTVFSQNENTDGFDIFIDGEIYNAFPINYENGITEVQLDFIGNGSVSEILVVDHLENDCRFVFNEIVPVCSCDIASNVLISDCENGFINFDVSLNLDENEFQGFSLFIDGVLMPPISESVVGDSIYLNFNIFGDGLDHTFSADNSNCVITNSFSVPDCSCNLNIVNTDVSSCLDNDSVAVEVNFEYENLSDEFVSILVDGFEFSNSNMSLVNSSGISTYQVEVFGDGDIHSILISDANNELCFDEVDFSVSNCSCELSFNVELLESCNDALLGIYQINILNCKPESLVDILLDGEKINTVPILIESLIDDSYLVSIMGDGQIHNLTIVDSQNSDCFFSSNVETETCICELSIASTILNQCDSDGNYNIQIDISNGISDEEYLIFIDNVEILESPMSLNSNLIVLKMSADGQIHQIKVVEAVSNCIAISNIELPVCECELAIDVDLVSDCSIDQLEIWSVNVFSTDSILTMFDVYLDGLYYNSFDHNIPFTVFEVEFNGGISEFHEISIYNSNDNVCSDSISIFITECNCEINATISTSDCQDGSINISGILSHDNVIGPSFDLFIDNAFYATIDYNSNGSSAFNAQIPGDGELHKILIFDSDDSGCSFETFVQSQVCIDDNFCDLMFESFSDFNCNVTETNGTFQFSSRNSIDMQYELFVNNIKDIGSPFHYNPTGFNTVSVLENGCNELKILVRDISDSSCMIDTLIFPTINQFEFYYYPNPLILGNTLFLQDIRFEDFDKLLSFRLFNNLGQSIFNTELIGKQSMKINFKENTLAPGVYYFVLGNRFEYRGTLVVI